MVTPIDMINIGQDNRVTEAGGGDGDDVPLASVVTQRHSDSLQPRVTHTLTRIILALTSEQFFINTLFEQTKAGLY